MTVFATMPFLVDVHRAAGGLAGATFVRKRILHTVRMRVTVFMVVMMFMLIVLMVATFPMVMIMVMFMRKVDIELDPGDALAFVLSDVQMEAVEF